MYYIFRTWERPDLPTPAHKTVCSCNTNTEAVDMLRKAVIKWICKYLHLKPNSPEMISKIDEGTEITPQGVIWQDKESGVKFHIGCDYKN